MMRTFITTSVIVGSMFALATPAVAAPTESTRTVSTFASLTSYSTDCTTEADGSQSCIRITVYAEEGGAARQSTELVLLYITQFSLDAEGNYIPISFEFARTEGDGNRLDINRDLTATLKPTTVTMQQTGREVSVSATYSPTGDTYTTRQVNTAVEANCTIRTTINTSVAFASGAVTLDGVTYDTSDETGNVQKSSTSELRRCS